VLEKLSATADVEAAANAEPAAEAPPPAAGAGDWGYQPWNGPGTWHRQYPVAKGRRQSPIDLREADLKLELGGGGLPQLFGCFQPASGLRLENTGASWLLSWPQDDPDAACLLRGGPLASEYRLLQMHAHWGAGAGRGSEHTLEGRSMEGELHLVFYNSAYASPAEAMDQPDGLAVIGVFLSETAGAGPHPELDKITRLLAGVGTRGLAATIEEELNPGRLLPVTSQAYFTYPGSLTTPPLLESVTWLVMREPMRLPAAQMDQMRAMRSGPEADSPLLVDNFRPPCCAAGRYLRAGTM
jgi:carbonic anhydrase